MYSAAKGFKSVSQSQRIDEVIRGLQLIASSKCDSLRVWGCSFFFIKLYVLASAL